MEATVPVGYDCKTKWPYRGKWYDPDDKSLQLKLVSAWSHQISPIHESANIIIDMNKTRISIKRREYRWNDAYLEVWS